MDPMDFKTNNTSMDYKTNNTSMEQARYIADRAPKKKAHFIRPTTPPWSKPGI